ncbi:MAG: hypothetical protein AAGF97_08265, partial [Planctomycetota bacterium]
MLSLRQVTAVLFLLPVLSSPLVADVAGPSRLATFTDGDSRYYALSLSAQLEPRPEIAREVVVLFDTSASQSGAVRDEQFDCLETLFDGLPESARVRLMALDLDAVELHEGFGEVNSPKINAAIERLRQRAPLGATDMRAGIEAAIEGHKLGDPQPRHIVYIGDGISRANLLHKQEFTQLVLNLIEHRISVSSLAVGPRHDGHLLATLANHTGGMVLIAADRLSGQQAGVTLAQAVQVPVLWPEQFAFEPAVGEMYPVKFPPVRGDRDSILIGSLEGSTDQITLNLRGTVAEELTEVCWELVAEESNDEFRFLGDLLQIARSDEGLALPTAGTEGLLEVSQLLHTEAAQPEDAQPEQTPATTEENKVGRVLPAAAEALEVSDAAWRSLHRFRSADATQLTQVIIGEPPLESGVVIEESFESENGRLADAVEARQRARIGVLRAEVRAGLAAAREMMSTNPAGAVRDLKVLRESVRRAPDIPNDVTVELSSQIESGIRVGQTREIEKENRDAQIAANRAVAMERDRIVRATIRDEEQVKQLLNRFNSLMDEGRYALARKAAIAPGDILGRDPVVAAAVGSAHYASRYFESREIWIERERGFFDTMIAAERAFIPFPDDPPMVYPPAEQWEAITAQREKYQSVDVASRGDAEQKIAREMKASTEVEFFDTPLADAMAELSDLHDINIVVDNTSLETLGLDSSEPVTASFSGISLKSALRLILRDLELTYVIRDEVLVITSEDEALTELVTRVYPVGDLVVPIISGGGGFGGGAGGFGAGGGGFGGGGLGGGGGG